MKKAATLLCILLCLLFQQRGSARIYPMPYTTSPSPAIFSDTVKLIVHTVTSSTSIRLHFAANVTDSASGSTYGNIDIAMCYAMTPGARMIDYYDTVLLVKLPRGGYNIRLTAYGSWDNECSDIKDSLKTTDTVFIGSAIRLGARVLPGQPDKYDNVGLELAAKVPTKAKHIGTTLMPIQMATPTDAGYVEIYTCYGWQYDKNDIDTWRLDTLSLGMLSPGMYMVKAVGYIGDDTANCSGLFDSSIAMTPFLVAIPQKIEDVTNAGITVYPNPARDVLNISLPAGIAAREVYIQNMAGITIKKFGNISVNMDISSLPAGLYILKIETDSGSLVQKLLKE